MKPGKKVQLALGQHPGRMARISCNAVASLGSAAEKFDPKARWFTAGAAVEVTLTRCGLRRAFVLLARKRMRDHRWTPCRLAFRQARRTSGLIIQLHTGEGCGNLEVCAACQTKEASLHDIFGLE